LQADWRCAIFHISHTRQNGATIVRNTTIQTLALSLTLAAVAPANGQTPAAAPAPAPIEVGTVAPDFTLPGATRYGVLAQPIRLSDFKGKTVVLAFFPKARTSGCTIQMHAYRDQYAELLNAGQNVVLIAISADPADALAAWARDDQFQFLMASDAGLALAKQYGALRAGNATTTNRNLFVVGPDGRIAYRAVPFREVDPTSYETLGQAIDKLAAPASK
jgi:peroxiredoxin